MPISLANLLLAALLAQGSATQECEPPVLKNAQAKAVLYQKTQVIYVKPDTPHVPDSNPDTLQFMAMSPDDGRSSRVSDDGQVMYLRSETINETCQETFLRLLDQSYDIRLQSTADGA